MDRYVSPDMTSDSSGDATLTTGNFQGRIVSIHWRPAADMGAGTTLTVATEETSRTLLNAVNVGQTAQDYQISVAVHDSAGSPVAGTVDYPPIASEGLVLTIASATAAKTATVHIGVE